MAAMPIVRIAWQQPSGRRAKREKIQLIESLAWCSSAAGPRGAHYPSPAVARLAHTMVRRDALEPALQRANRDLLIAVEGG